MKIILALLIGGLVQQVDAQREYFTLQHVIDAEEALRAKTSDDLGLQEKLFADFQLTKSGFGPRIGGFITYESQANYITRFGSGRPHEEADKYTGYLHKIPPVVPRVDDRETIISMGKMASEAYERNETNNWRNRTGFNRDLDFGWDSSGLRGHVYSNADNSVMVIAFKGTSTILMGGGTVARDKYMDNIMFSCCCARVDISWKPVCGCYSGSVGKKELCDNVCLRDTVQSDKTSYYMQVLAVAQLTIAKYPRAQIWFTGHSLGGGLAGLAAVSIRKTAAITFEAPGVALYAKRLGLHDGQSIEEMSQYPIWNFGLSSDPIYMGTCNGMGTACYIGGYALETVCRHGNDCIFKVDSWRPDVTTHVMSFVLDNVLLKPDQHPLPVCKPVVGCVDCAKWRFIDKVGHPDDNPNVAEL